MNFAFAPSDRWAPWPHYYQPTRDDLPGEWIQLCHPRHNWGSLRWFGAEHKVFFREGLRFYSVDAAGQIIGVGVVVESSHDREAFETAAHGGYRELVAWVSPHLFDNVLEWDGLQNVTQLYLQGAGPGNNHVSCGVLTDDHIRPFASLCALSLGLEALTQLNVLQDLTHLAALDLYVEGPPRSDRPVDLAPLAKLQRLVSLSLNGGRCSNTDKLESLDQLRALTLSGHVGIDSALDIACSLPSLKYFSWSPSQYSPLSPKVRFPSVTGLEFTNYASWDARALPEDVEHLWLRGTAPGNVEAIAGLARLRSIELHWEEVRDYRFVAALTQLSTCRVLHEWDAHAALPLFCLGSA